MVQRLWSIIENISPNELGMVCKVKYTFSFLATTNYLINFKNTRKDVFTTCYVV